MKVQINLGAEFCVLKKILGAKITQNANGQGPIFRCVGQKQLENVTDVKVKIKSEITAGQR